MEIHVDYNPKNHKPKNHFFVSVHQTKKECISFDKTIKGHRIIKKDLINNEIWETIWEKPISKELTKKILFYSQLISGNFQHLDRYKKEMSDFEEMLKEQIKKLT